MVKRNFIRLREKTIHPCLNIRGMLEYRPHNVLGARLMAGQLTLDQFVEVRILCPQPKDLRKRVLFNYAMRFVLNEMYVIKNCIIGISLFIRLIHLSIV